MLQWPGDRTFIFKKKTKKIQNTANSWLLGVKYQSITYDKTRIIHTNKNISNNLLFLCGKRVCIPTQIQSYRHKKDTYCTLNINLMSADCTFFISPLSVNFQTYLYTDVENIICSIKYCIINNTNLLCSNI